MRSLEGKFVVARAINLGTVARRSEMEFGRLASDCQNSERGKGLSLGSGSDC